MKYITPLLIALFVLLSTGAVSADTMATTLDATLLNVVPTPAQPGEIVEVYIQLENQGNSDVRNVKIEALTNNLFSPVGDTEISVGTIGGQSVYVARFRMRVAQDTPSGDNDMIVAVSQQGTPKQERSITIPVLESQSTATISKSSSSTEKITPGMDTELEIVVTNNADIAIRDVSLTLDLDETSLIPLSQGQKASINRINAGATHTFRYTLAVSPKATAEIVRIPATLNYLDSSGARNTVEDTVGLKIQADARTRAFVDDVSRTDGEVEVLVRIVNNGLAEIKFVDVQIQNGQGYSVPEQDKNVYIGNIDTDDWETVRFSVDATSDTITIPVEYSFSDSYNNQQTVQESFTIEIPPAPAKTGSPTLWIAIIIVILIAGFFWWRKRKSAR